MTQQLNTPQAVLSFPVLFNPRPRAEGGEPCFSCALLFSPEQQKSAEFKKMQTAVLEAAKEKFGQTINVKNLILPFRDAGEKEYAGYEDGVIYITPWAGKDKRPGIVDNRLQDVLDPNEVFAGQIVRASVSPFAWTKSNKRGVSFGLNHIQILKKNAPRIDGRVPANKSFTAVDDEDDDEIPF
jgi:hypothetical protein